MNRGRFLLLRNVQSANERTKRSLRAAAHIPRQEQVLLRGRFGGRRGAAAATATVLSAALGRPFQHLFAKCATTAWKEIKSAVMHLYYLLRGLHGEEEEPSRYGQVLHC